MRVGGHDNSADWGTKHLHFQTMNKHLRSCGMRFTGGRSKVAIPLESCDFASSDDDQRCHSWDLQLYEWQDEWIAKIRCSTAWAKAWAEYWKFGMRHSLKAQSCNLLGTATLQGGWCKSRLKVMLEECSDDSWVAVTARERRAFAWAVWTLVNVRRPAAMSRLIAVSIGSVWRTDMLYDALSHFITVKLSLRSKWWEKHFHFTNTWPLWGFCNHNYRVSGRRDSGERISRPRALTSPVLGMKTVRLASSPWGRAAQPEGSARWWEVPWRAVPSVVLTKMCLSVRRRLCPFPSLRPPSRPLIVSPGMSLDYQKCHCIQYENPHIPSQPAVVPSPRRLLSRDQSLRPDAWNLLGTSGTVFANPPALIDWVSTPSWGMFHSWNPNATGGDSMQPSTGRLVDRSEEQSRDTIPTPRIARRPWIRNSLLSAEGVADTEVPGWSTKTSDLGISL